MPIPDYQSIMLPLLKYCGDGKEHITRNLVDAMAMQFNISENEKKQLILSGTQPLYYNRITWALAYLKKSGLLETSKRAHYQITELGRGVLLSNPSELTRAFLLKFPSFAEFQNIKLRADSQQQDMITPFEEPFNNEKLSPDDVIEKQYEQHRAALAADLLASIMEASPSFFEKLVVELLLAMGYGGTKKDAFAGVTGQSGDEGIDGVIQEDRLGLDVVYIQAKRWKDSSAMEFTPKSGHMKKRG